MADIRTFIRISDEEHVIGESDRLMARTQVVLAPSPTAAYLPGTVLGRITASGQYARHDPAASDGTQTAAGILLQGRRKSAGTSRAVVHNKMQSVHNGKKLTWKAGITDNQRAAGVAALATLGVQVRY